MPITAEEVSSLTRSIALAIKRKVDELVDKRVAALEKRIAELESAKLKYLGIWKAGPAEYRHGNIVTHGGVLWHCWKSTTTRPGTSDDWQMMLKHER
jgi:hypothetical protein